MAIDDSLINALLRPEFYPHHVANIELVETHISWVVLTGDYVYKIKKPVDFGFLDFSSLDKRHFCCEEELRLNQRLAPDMYLAVVAITGSNEHPVLDGPGDVIEYAVKMKQFDQSQQLDHVLEREELSESQIDAVADLLAAFHQSVPPADTATTYGDPEHVIQPVEENFIQILQQLPGENYRADLLALQAWSKASFDDLRDVIAARKGDGFVRECHGDMHLRNIAWIEDRPLVFDCIEFNPNLYWIDVINDIAFLVMDLQDRGQQRLAARLLNAYLENTGDYQGLQLLRFYLLYRAMVLAKVNAIRAGQTTVVEERERAVQDFSNYVQLGLDYINDEPPRLYITYGLSGSGKSVVSATLAQAMGAIRIRSDVERKRLHGIRPDESAAADNDAGIYTASATEQTYARLADLASLMLQAGWSVIVDAAFLKQSQRDQFRQLAQECQAVFRILDIQADEATLRERVKTRQGDVSDANLEVLEHQLRSFEPVSNAEREYALAVNTQQAIDYARLASA